MDANSPSSDLPTVPGADDGDRRGTGRQRALKQAKVVFGVSSTINCTITELSAEGARLSFSGPTGLPEEFSLMTLATGRIVPVQLLWQKGLSAGVAFAGPDREMHPHRK